MGPRVVLVVEDEGVVRDLVAVGLRYAGFEVLEAISAEDAIAYMSAGQRIDVVFTDIQLAGDLSGWDLAEQLRVTQPHLPIIYTSGNSVDRSRKVAGSLFFEKPYLPAEVAEACRRLC
jgi:two-component system, response regulator PdtaR